MIYYRKNKEGVMQTEKKKFYQTLLFWEVLIGALVILGIVIFLIIELKKPVPNLSETDDGLSDVSDFTQESTEETLPPPEANPIGLGDFAMEGDYLSCLTTPSVLGIDVSFWQGNIDWQQVKQAGVEFAMIRAGWRGSEQGLLSVDDSAQANYAGAANAGLQVGVYFFSQAISVDEAEEEARYLLDIIKNWNVEMPVVFDWEYVSADSRTGNIDARTLTDCTKAFCEVIKAAGYTPMVYFSANQSFDSIYLEELTDYQFWLAQYNTVLNYPYKIEMWQYTDAGSVPGISGNVDINLYFPWEE